RVGSFFVLGLAVIPGLPSLPFLVIGALMLLASRARQQSLRAAPSQPEPIQRRAGAEAQPRFVPLVVPWSVEVAEDLEPCLHDAVRAREGRGAGPGGASSACREIVFRERGVPLPPGRAPVSETLPARHVLLSLHELPAQLIALPVSLAEGELAQRLLLELIPT